MSKFSEKFLGILNLNDEEDDYDVDDYDMDEDDDLYEEEDEVEEKPKKKLFGRNSSSKSYDDEEESYSPKKSRGFKGSKVVPMNGNRRDMEVCVIRPKNVDEAREVTDTLLSGRAVVLNLEGLHVDVAQRIIDFTSGSCYAIDGNLQKISNYIFIITPASVDISGDFQDMVDGGFDVAAFK